MPKVNIIYVVVEGGVVVNAYGKNGNDCVKVIDMDEDDEELLNDRQNELEDIQSNNEELYLI